MTSNLPDKKSSAQDVQAFIGKVKNAPLVTGIDKGRLIFAMDATASREHCWDMASQKHAAMFAEADKVSALSVQLCYYRGMGDFTALPWTRGADEIKHALLSVRCLAGQTQIAKVLAHALSETRKSKVNALVFVGRQRRGCHGGVFDRQTPNRDLAELHDEQHDHDEQR